MMIRTVTSRTAFALLCLLWTAVAAVAEPRIALVIGNSSYASVPLANPKNDAETMARALKAVGFEVTKLIDADQKALRKAILDFGRRLRTSDSVGLFYYAGHGVQVDGENYLIPIGSDIADEREVAVEGVNVAELLRTMERSPSRINIAILDACRNNPFAGANRSGARGLAQVDAPSGMIIAYATAPGQVALDGDNGNSPYTSALAQSVAVSGLPIEEVFKRTRRNVLTATQNKQTPWESSSLTGDFYFKPKTAAPEATARADMTDPADAQRLAELRAWDKIRLSSSRGDYERHIAAYPNGVFAELARVKITQLKPAQPLWPWTSDGIVTGSPKSVSSTREVDSLYARALRLDTPAASPDDLAEAARLYAEAADLGLPAAQHALARLYDRGRGVEKSLATAADLYRRAADKGYPPAMVALATMLEFGDGVAADLPEAIRLYTAAANLGDMHAMTSLGFLHAAGKGMSVDYIAARKWYTSAAELGQTRAMFNLALLNMRGEGAKPNAAEAVRWLAKAAEAGHAGAMRELAFFYDEGRGVSRDPRKAAINLLTAYKAGHAGAREDLFTRSGSWSYATRREVQEQLVRAGVLNGRTTGFFDQRTRAALETYRTKAVTPG
jgi:TPR repeat protein